MPEYRPTREQQAILDHQIGVHARVLAGPGTGKSATLVALIDRLLAGEVSPRVRLLTFTRAATAELAKKVSAHPAAAAQRPSTVHSFAIAVLVRNPGAGGFPEPLRIADPWEYASIVRPTLARRVGVDVRTLDRLVREMAANWESLMPQEDPEIDPALRARFLGAWDEHRRVLGYTLLQELPDALRRALSDHQDLEGVDYDLLVVDEYQDLNACDLELIKLLAATGCSIVGAGDDDQSIYSFRKADPQGIRRFRDDYAESADYALSITQRCGGSIIDWASHVIEGDPDRPLRPRLRTADGSPAGEVALLSFAGHVAEARGIARLVRNLTEREGIEPGEILVLLRGDHQGSFSRPIKQELDHQGVPYADPDAVERMLEERDNRRLLEILRLIARRDDPIAWASLLRLEAGVGDGLFSHIYDHARDARVQFGAALLSAYAEGFTGGPAASVRRATALIEAVLAWLDAHQPLDSDSDSWAQWIIETVGDEVVPVPSDALRDLLTALDGVIEAGSSLGRYLGQIQPIGEDLAQSTSAGVRIMSMAASKGLTVKATIIAALEDGIVPRPNVDLAEERRLLYVAMTRARQFVYGTWARRRTGPTARAGLPRVTARRNSCWFLNGGPVASQDGNAYMEARWG